MQIVEIDNKKIYVMDSNEYKEIKEAFNYNQVDKKTITFNDSIRNAVEKELEVKESVLKDLYTQGSLSKGEEFDINPNKFYTMDNKKLETNLETNKDYIKSKTEDKVSYKFAMIDLSEPQSEGLKHKGLRYNQGKLRYDLVNPWAHEQLVKVFTKGAEKYEARNWEKGMSWTSVIASLKRHLEAIERGEDYDQETGMLHSAHVQWNSHCLTAYYKLYPQGDDRPHTYLNRPKIGLDIDEVLCDWIGAWTNKFDYPIPKNWRFSYNNKKEFESFSKEELENFYLSIPRKLDPDEIPFEPYCYITSRSVPRELTEEWLRMNGFSCAPVYSLGWGESKVDMAKKSGIDIFVDDRYENFVELNKAGVCTYLLTAPHNERYNVGHKRLNSLKDLIY